MPEQVFKATAKFPSGKTRPIQVKLVNFRGDPEDPDDMERALKYANKLTPGNVTVLRDGFELIHDNPAEDLQTGGVDDLVARPVELQTDTVRSNPVVRRPTQGGEDADAPQPVSRAIRPEDLPAPGEGSDAGLGGSDAPGSGSIDQRANQQKAPESGGRSPGNQKRASDKGS